MARVKKLSAKLLMKISLPSWFGGEAECKNVFKNGEGENGLNKKTGGKNIIENFFAELVWRRGERRKWMQKLLGQNGFKKWLKRK